MQIFSSPIWIKSKNYQPVYKVFKASPFLPSLCVYLLTISVSGVWVAGVIPARAAALAFPDFRFCGNL